MDANYLIVNLETRELIEAMPECRATVNMKVRPGYGIGYSIIRTDGSRSTLYYNNTLGHTTHETQDEDIHAGDHVIFVANDVSAETGNLNLYPPEGGWIDLDESIRNRPQVIPIAFSNQTLDLSDSIDIGQGGNLAYIYAWISIDAVICANDSITSHLKIHDVDAPLNKLGPFHVDKSVDGGANWVFLGSTDPDVLSFVDAGPGPAQYRLRQTTWPGWEIPYNKVTVG